MAHLTGSVENVESLMSMGPLVNSCPKYEDIMNPFKVQFKVQFLE